MRKIIALKNKGIAVIAQDIPVLYKIHTISFLLSTYMNENINDHKPIKRILIEISKL